MLDLFIKRIKFLKHKKNFSVNTRAELLYESISGNKFIICIDMFNILLNGKPVKRNKEFLNFIRLLIPKEQLTMTFPKTYKK